MATGSGFSRQREQQGPRRPGELRTRWVAGYQLNSPFIDQTRASPPAPTEPGIVSLEGESAGVPKQAPGGTGRQNSSKAGLTKVVYWVRICSRSLPRFTSRRTAATGARWPPSDPEMTAQPRPGEGGRERLTSPRQPDVGVRVHKEAQVEHVPDLLAVEDQDALKQDHVRRVHHRGLR